MPRDKRFEQPRSLSRGRGAERSGRAARADLVWLKALPRSPTLPYSLSFHREDGGRIVTLDEYQIAAARTLNPQLNDQEKLLDAAAGIAEEAGEVLAHVRKHLYQGRELNRERLAEELGDVLWCIAAVATICDLDLASIAQQNQAKLAARHPPQNS